MREGSRPLHISVFVCLHAMFGIDFETGIYAVRLRW